MKTLLIGILFIAFHFNSQAQKPLISEASSEFESKISELYTQYKIDGFVTYKGGTIQMKKNTEFPIYIELIEGRWYQFAVVGDPEAKKIEMKLGLVGVGDFITDKFKPVNTNEFWTSFSFICPRSGKYLMTFYQKGPRKNLKGHVAILQKTKQSENGNFTFK